MIETYFKEKKVEVFKEVPFEMNSDAPSSTKIRQALKAGEIHKANQFLGRPYSIFGRVGHGEAKGRTIGFPTANLQGIESLTPGQGVYVVNADIEGRWKKAVCNVGVRPTLGGQSQSVEVHILDYDQDLYGKNLKIQFLTKIREEKKFQNFDMLKGQIEKDVQFARNFEG